MFRSITVTSLTLFLSGLTVLAVRIALDLPLAGKSLYEILLRHKKPVYLLLILLILSVPVVFSIPESMLLSPRVSAIFVRKLLVSSIMVASFVGTWKLLGYAEGVARVCAWQLSNILPLLTDLNQQRTIRLDSALSALDRGDIGPGVVEELDQLQSLHKWILRGDVTGRYELLEEARFGGGLHFVVRLLIKTLLWWGKHGEHENGLRLLLSC